MWERQPDLLPPSNDGRYPTLGPGAAGCLLCQGLQLPLKHSFCAPTRAGLKSPQDKREDYSILLGIGTITPGSNLCRLFAALAVCPMGCLSCCRLPVVFSGIPLQLVLRSDG